MFGMKSSTPASPVTGSGDGPFVSVDARLPEPAILTCNQDIPLSIIVKRLNSSADAVYLQSLQVSLIAVTKIRAHEVFRVENNSWIIMSKSNMNVLLPFSSGAEGAEAVVDDGLWRGQALPNTVAPTFETCNISRAYTLDVRVGLSYAGTTASGKVRKHDIPRIVRSSVSCFMRVCSPTHSTADTWNSHKRQSYHCGSIHRSTPASPHLQRSSPAWHKHGRTQTSLPKQVLLLHPPRWMRSYALKVANLYPPVPPALDLLPPSRPRQRYHLVRVRLRRHRILMTKHHRAMKMPLLWICRLWMRQGRIMRRLLWAKTTF